MRISDWSSDVCSSDLAWRWLCLDHVREFNKGYNYFSGMTTDEIQEAQRPYAGWERETRAFSSNATSPPPRWQDFTDPIDAIGARFQERMREARARQDGKPLSDDDRKALRTLRSEERREGKECVSGVRCGGVRD